MDPMARRPAHRVLASVALAAALGATWHVAAGAQASNPQDGRKKPWTPSRTSDGQPDISGFFTHVGFGTGKEDNPAQLCPGGGAGGRNNCYESEWAAEPKGKLTLQLKLDVFDPPDGKLPLRPEAAALKEEYKRSQGDPRELRHIDTQTRCLHSGVPRSNFAIGYVGYQIIQGAGYVALYTEYNHEFRFIPTDGRPHVGKGVRTFGGDSVGRWDGSTLVVDTVNIAVPPATGAGYLDMQGTPFSDALHVVERFTPLDPDTIAVEIAIDDPKMYTKPWKTAGAFVRGPKSYEVFEYACHEGNVGMQNLSFQLPRKKASTGGK
jgi:hypothetical protein